MKVRIRIEQVDNGVVFRWEDLEEIEDPRCMVYTDSEKELSIGQQILDDVKCEMDRSFVNTIEMEINYKPIGENKENLGGISSNSSWSDEDMKEALRTEYEKGRADAIAEIREKWDDSKKKRQEVISFLESLRLKED